MSDPRLIKEIMKAVSIPVMAKVRIGHFAEAQILEALKVDYIDESEVLTPADERHHIDKHAFTITFVCGCRDLGEALRRIGEGAAMIRTKGEAGTGDIVEAVRHARTVLGAIRDLKSKPDDELMAFARDIGAPYEVVKQTKEQGKLPVVNFAAGGIAKKYLAQHGIRVRGYLQQLAAEHSKVVRRSVRGAIQTASDDIDEVLFDLEEQQSEIAAMAEAHGVSVAPHNPLGPVATMANLHLAVATPNHLIQEVMRSDVPWRDEIVRGVPPIVDGHMAPPEAPGLGVEIDEAAAAEHPYQPEPQYRWFHEDGGVAEW